MQTLPSGHRRLVRPPEMSVCRESQQTKVEARAGDASSADTTPAQRSEPQTAREDAEETTGR